MPYKVFGKCVHKLNADGSKGEVVKCHEDEGSAKRHMRALYANVHEGLAEFSMAIVKTSEKDGEMRWRSVNSDTGSDYFDERMSKELFEDMISRIDNNTPIPVAFRSAICEEGWCGGTPYVSVAHYKSAGGKNVPGEVKSLYVDGDKLKSTGILYNTPLGKAVYKSLSKDLVEKRESDKVRISIAFIDLEHSHGDRFTFVRRAVGEKCPLCAEGIGDKIYKKGILVHLALTRKPANPRTDMEVEKSMTTKLEDAKSIVEDEDVLKEMELKSLTDEVLVVKADSETAHDAEDCEEDDPECQKKHDKMHAEMKSEATQNVPESVVVPIEAPVAPVVPVVETPVAPVTPAELSALQKSIVAFQDRVLELKSKGLKGDDALKELQPTFDELGNVVRAEFTPQPTAQEIVTQNLESTLRSLLAEMLPQYLSQSVAPIQAEVSELRALSTAVKPQAPVKPTEVQPRSLSLNLTQKSAVEKLTQPASQFKQLARQSVGLPD